jgi:hypothetical protein
MRSGAGKGIHYCWALFIFPFSSNKRKAYYHEHQIGRVLSLSRLCVYGSGLYATRQKETMTTTPYLLGDLLVF